MVKNPLSQGAGGKSTKKFSSIVSAVISYAGSIEGEKLFVSRSCPGVIGV